MGLEWMLKPEDKMHISSDESSDNQQEEALEEVCRFFQSCFLLFFIDINKKEEITKSSFRRVMLG